MKTQKKLTRVCPVCKEERIFIRVVEAHEEHYVPERMGQRGHDYLVETEHPTAYCPVCKIVIHVGPTAKEIKKEFEAREKKETTGITLPFDVPPELDRISPKGKSRKTRPFPMLKT